jgi:hypothetical protein
MYFVIGFVIRVVMSIVIDSVICFLFISFNLEGIKRTFSIHKSKLNKGLIRDHAKTNLNVSKQLRT